MNRGSSPAFEHPGEPVTRGVGVAQRIDLIKAEAVRS